MTNLVQKVEEMEKYKVDESVKKGPWTAEEDEVLINYVDKYGAKDWSLIRSMGLLPRTGKSCRLRWVNKLRPNLIGGCKFTAEEERVVIDLQARFGNKWATIAKYLPGRTDNDVKNFWSSRLKRLGKISHSPSPINKSSHKHKGKAYEFTPLQAVYKMEECATCPQMLPHPDLLPTHLPFNDLYYQHNAIGDATLLPLMPDHHDTTFDLFGTHKEDELDDMPRLSFGSESKLETLSDSFFDELPADMFECLEPNPSSSSLSS